MATLTLTYPDAQAPLVLDAICWKYGYTDRVLNAQNVSIPNPESRAAFAKRMVAAYVRGVYREYLDDVNLRAIPVVPDIPIT